MINNKNEIVLAQPKDAVALTELTLLSKDYWNYGRDQIEAWREELTITEQYINGNEVYKLLVHQKLAGFYAYQPTESKAVKLNFFFLHPEFIGKGLGKLLLSDFLNRIQQEGYKSATLDADPNAESFYKNAGFKVIGQFKSSIKDRYLPIMEYAF